MPQRGDSVKPTRFRGPAVVTLRGAGSSGNDPLIVGAGSDVGLRIQIPMAQTAFAFTIEQPDGTVIFSIDKTGTILPVPAIFSRLEARVAALETEVAALQPRTPAKKT